MRISARDRQVRTGADNALFGRWIFCMEQPRSFRRAGGSMRRSFVKSLGASSLRGPLKSVGVAATAGPRSRVELSPQRTWPHRSYREWKASSQE